MIDTLKQLRARVVVPMHWFGPSSLARFLAGIDEEFEIETRRDATVVLSDRTPAAQADGVRDPAAWRRRDHGF